MGSEVRPIILALPAAIERMRTSEGGLLSSVSDAIARRVGQTGGQVHLVIVDHGANQMAVEAEVLSWIRAFVGRLPLRNFMNSEPELRVVQHTGGFVTVSAVVNFTRTALGAFILLSLGDQFFNKGRLMTGISHFFGPEVDENKGSGVTNLTLVNS